jgi:MFS-type transporter involved in bile tolerance (Atg22 family)
VESSLRNYLTVTGGYWAFTVTDGAIRMLVVLYFHLLGYSPFEVAMLFLFYEFFGVVTNLVGGWLGARIGLNLTMHIGMGMQIVALAPGPVGHRQGSEQDVGQGLGEDHGERRR